MNYILQEGGKWYGSFSQWGLIEITETDAIYFELQG